MIFIKRHIISTLLFCSFTILSARAEQVLLGAEDSWPPYSDKNGEGIATNLIKAAYKKVGIDVKIQVRPYARVLQDVKNGLLDGGYDVTRQENTEREFIFGREPIFQAKAFWYFPPNTPHKFSNLAAIPNGFRVGGIIDYEYGDIYEHERHRFNEIRVSRQSQLVNMLIRGRLDAAIMFEEEANQTLIGMNLPSEAITKVIYNHTSDIYVAFSKKRQSARFYAEELDKGITLLKISGEYERLLKPDTP